MVTAKKAINLRTIRSVWCVVSRRANAPRENPVPFFPSPFLRRISKLLFKREDRIFGRWFISFVPELRHRGTNIHFLLPLHISTFFRDLIKFNLFHRNFDRPVKRTECRRQFFFEKRRSSYICIRIVIQFTVALAKLCNIKKIIPKAFVGKLFLEIYCD